MGQQKPGQNNGSGLFRIVKHNIADGIKKTVNNSPSKTPTNNPSNSKRQSESGFITKKVSI